MNKNIQCVTLCDIPLYVSDIPLYDTVSGNDTVINIDHTNSVYVVQTFFDGKSYISGVFNSKESAEKLVEKLKAKKMSDEIFSITEYNTDIGECINVIDYE